MFGECDNKTGLIFFVGNKYMNLPSLQGISIRNLYRTPVLFGKIPFHSCRVSPVDECPASRVLPFKAGMSAREYSETYRLALSESSVRIESTSLDHSWEVIEDQVDFDFPDVRAGFFRFCKNHHIFFSTAESNSGIRFNTATCRIPAATKKKF